MGTQRWIGLPYAGITQIRFKEYFSAALASGTSSTIDYGSTQWRKPAALQQTPEAIRLRDLSSPSFRMQTHYCFGPMKYQHFAPLLQRTQGSHVVTLKGRINSRIRTPRKHLTAINDCASLGPHGVVAHLTQAIKCVHH